MAAVRVATGVDGYDEALAAETLGDLGDDLGAIDRRPISYGSDGSLPARPLQQARWWTGWSECAITLTGHIRC